MFSIQVLVRSLSSLITICCCTRLVFRSFLVFPLRLTIPGRGEFIKQVGFNMTYNNRPVYTNQETAERIFFERK